MPTALTLPTEPRPALHRPRVSRATVLVVDVLYVGMDVLTALTIERAGFGVDQALSLADARRWLARKRYRVLAVDVVGDAVLGWLTRLHDQRALTAPIVVRDGGEIVSFAPHADACDHTGTPLASVVTRMLART